jgi:hypothetical protein
MHNSEINGVRCPGCPLAHGSRCAGFDVPRLCQLVDPDDSSFDPSYLAALTIDVEATPSVPRRPLSAALQLLRAVRSCPHRSERPACGCTGGAACGLGRGDDGFVSLSDCLDCLSGPPGAMHYGPERGAPHDAL